MTQVKEFLNILNREGLKDQIPNLKELMYNCMDISFGQDSNYYKKVFDSIIAMIQGDLDGVQVELFMLLNVIKIFIDIINRSIQG